MDLNNIPTAQRKECEGIFEVRLAASQQELRKLAELLKNQAEEFQLKSYQMILGARELAGGQRRLAAALDIKESTVRQWLKRGAAPSIKNVVLVCAFVANKVTGVENETF